VIKPSAKLGFTAIRAKHQANTFKRFAAFIKSSPWNRRQKAEGRRQKAEGRRQKAIP
jgi:hypothetical protein